jgi:hypothetical protein
VAILKHIPSHNRFYQDAVNYFLFQHDDHARPIYNAQHKMILRDNVLIDAINGVLGTNIPHIDEIRWPTWDEVKEAAGKA